MMLPITDVSVLQALLIILVQPVLLVLLVLLLTKQLARVVFLVAPLTNIMITLLKAVSALLLLPIGMDNSVSPVQLPNFGTLSYLNVNNVHSIKFTMV